MKLISVVLFLAGTLVLIAHDTWIEPLSPAVASEGPVQFDLTSADGFKGLDHAIDPSRVERAIVRSGKVARDLSIEGKGRHALRFSTTLDQPGVAVVGVQLKPRTLDLALDKVELYFDEIHASDELRAEWARMPEPRRWRERYAKCAKTFVAVGGGASARDWAEPLGFSIEIVPDVDPSALRVGEIFAVRVLKRGSPFGGFRLAFVSEGEKSHVVRATDADGHASIVPDRPGKWLVRGTDLRRSTSPDLEWESDFVTMVVNVRSR